MSYRNLQTGDVVAFTIRIGGALEQRTAAVLRYLTFPTHVVVHYGSFGYVVDDSNFVRVVRSARGSVPHAQRGGHHCTAQCAGVGMHEG